MSGKAIVNSVFVCAFFWFWAYHTATGVIYEATGVAPRAVLVLDGLTQTTLVGPLGLANAVGVLAFLGVALGYVAFQRVSNERRRAATADCGGSDFGDDAGGD